VPDGEDWTGRQSHHLFGDAAEQKVREPVTAMRAHHNQIDDVFSCVPDDDKCGCACRDDDRCDGRSALVAVDHQLLKSCARIVLDLRLKVWSDTDVVLGSQRVEVDLLHDVQHVKRRAEPAGQLTAVGERRIGSFTEVGSNENSSDRHYRDPTERKGEPTTPLAREPTSS